MAVGGLDGTRAAAVLESSNDASLLRRHASKASRPRPVAKSGSCGWGRDRDRVEGYSRESLELLAVLVMVADPKSQNICIVPGDPRHGPGIGSGGGAMMGMKKIDVSLACLALAAAPFR